MFTNYNTRRNLNDFGLLLLRVFFGLAMCFGHGWSKWHMLFNGEDIKFPDPFGIGALPSLALAVFAEVICGILLAFGLLTRWSLIPLVFTMLIAVFVIHISDGFGTMEKAMLYGVAYLALFFTGPGKYSMDAFLKTKKNNIKYRG